MTQRDAVDVAADWAREIAEGICLTYDIDMRHEKADEIRDAIAEALRSASNSGAEAMREAVNAALAKKMRSYNGNSFCWDNAYEEAIEVVATLPALGAPATPWRVKKLEWEAGMHGAPDTAGSLFGFWSAWDFGQDGYYTSPWRHLGIRVDGDINAAKAAAQADFEARIRSVIEPDPKPASPWRPAGLDFNTLRDANTARQTEWDTGNQLTLAYRGNELAGEVGETCNVLKKIERERLGIRGSRATLDDLATELADVIICADLIAMAEGIDLGAAVATKFNATSEKVGLATRLPTPPASKDT